MIWKIDTTWLVFALIIVAMLTYLLGFALDKIMKSDGFGAAGNMIILSVGFFGGIYLANLYGLRFKDLHMATAGGMAGAFLLLVLFAFGKALYYKSSS